MQDRWVSPTLTRAKLGGQTGMFSTQSSGFFMKQNGRNCSEISTFVTTHSFGQYPFFVPTVLQELFRCVNSLQ